MPAGAISMRSSCNMPTGVARTAFSKALIAPAALVTGPAAIATGETAGGACAIPADGAAIAICAANGAAGGGACRCTDGRARDTGGAEAFRADATPPEGAGVDCPGEAAPAPPDTPVL